MIKTYITIILISIVEFISAQPNISVLPETPYITKEGDIQHLDFDFIITGNKDGKYNLQQIVLIVYDKAGKVQQRNKIADEGMVSSFRVFPKTELKSDKKISLFNPFYFFGNNVQLHRLEYRFTFSKGKEKISLIKEVNPIEYYQQTQVVLPLKGRVIVDSGFDYYAHHRRLNTIHWGMKLLKISRNITRYAIDLAPAEIDGNTFRNTGNALEDYFGFGQEVFAPASGKVIEVAKDYPDNDINGKMAYGFFEFIKNPKLASGNYIVIDHLNGEVSLLAHLNYGSINVEVGQTVNTGDLMGKIGNSGDSTYPHLHFQLENEHSTSTKTFPVKFSGIESLNGVKVTKPEFCNTGDLIER